MKVMPHDWIQKTHDSVLPNSCLLLLYDRVLEYKITLDNTGIYKSVHVTFKNCREKKLAELNIEEL